MMHCCPVFIEFDLVNNRHLVYGIFYLPEFIPPFSLILTERTINAHICLLEIVPAQPLLSCVTSSPQN
jgi:hypothetical protein